MASTSNGNCSPPVPDLDLVAIAKTTRKTLDRLASFAHMRSSSQPSALLTKILYKITALIAHIDASMLAAQMGYALATNAMILCDAEEFQEEWDATDVTREGLRDTAGKALGLMRGVVEAFRDVKQEVYKIAASTKDNMLVVLVPPDPTHSETMKIHLKDVGADLVANLNLLSEYARAMTGVAEWWQAVSDDLGTAAPRLLPPLVSSNADGGGEPKNDAQANDETPDLFTKWLERKEAFQEYYNIINTAHVRFPELLPTSSAAWTSVAQAQARSITPSSAAQSLRNLPSIDNLPASGLHRRTRLGALAGIFGFGLSKKKSVKAKKSAEEKGKAKEVTHENQTGAEKPTRPSLEEDAAFAVVYETRSASNPTPSPPNTSHQQRTSNLQPLTETEKEKDEEGPRKGLCLCCSLHSFQSALAQLGCPGLVVP